MALPPLFLFLHPSPILTDEPPAALKLCRTGVAPCQQEVNLPVGGEVTVDISIESPQSPRPGSDISLGGWFFKMFFDGDDAVEVKVNRMSALPFEVRAGPGTALSDWKPLESNTVISGQPQPRYFQFRNSQDAETGELQYGVVLLDAGPGAGEHARIPPPKGKSASLAGISLVATQPGETSLLAARTVESTPSMFISDTRGRLNRLTLAADRPLFHVNVGPLAEKARLKGRVWTSLPATETARRPFTRGLAVEAWNAGAVPVWQGGSDLPLATFTNLAGDSRGNFEIPDLPAEIIPPGTYDLRAKGLGALSVLVRDVAIDTLGANSEQLPLIVEAAFGPLPLGDISGDNAIDRADLSLFKSDFGQMVPDTVTGHPGDISGDGVVDGQDFSLMAANFGRQGE